MYKFMVPCLAVITLTFTNGLYAAKTADGEKVDLTAIEVRLSILESELSDRQLFGSEKYEGTYSTIAVEWQYLGCQPSGTKVSDILEDGDDGTTAQYLINQQRSSFSTSTASFEATSSGGVITIPPYSAFETEFDLSGILYPEPGDEEGNFPLLVDGTGAISFPGGLPSGTTLTGQFSADGSMFQILAQGTVPTEDADEGCTDKWMQTWTGVRK